MSELQPTLGDRDLGGPREWSRVALESIGDAVLATDVEGRVTFLNPVARTLTGWGDEAIGRDISEVVLLIDETTRQTIEGPVVRALREGVIVGLAAHTLLIAKDGREVPIDDRAAPIRDDAGRIAGAVLTFRDIEERRRASRAAAERTRLSAFAADVGMALTQGDTLPDMLGRCCEGLVRHLDGAFARIWTLDEVEDVLVLRASAGMYTHLDGAHARVPVGRFKIGLIAQDRRPHLTNAVSGDPRVSDRSWAEREGMVAFAGYPLMVEERLVGVMAMFARHELSDATLQAMSTVASGIALGIERKRAEEEVRRLNRELEERVRLRTAELERANAGLNVSAAKLEWSNRELQEFASVASHDLQEPLRKIQAFGDRLDARCGAGLGDEGRDYLGRMKGAATRMRRLIDDLLAFSRVSTTAQPFAPLDLGEVAREVASDLEGRIEQTGGSIEVGALPRLEADPTQMRQLLQNLIGNGLKFHRPNVPPVIRVHGQALADAGQGHCAVVVEDNGIGFDEKYLDRIFNVFQRLHGRSEYEGTGMGLAICRKIVERHGGSITARSTPGAGATFVVTLPLVQPGEFEEEPQP